MRNECERGRTVPCSSFFASATVRHYAKKVARLLPSSICFPHTWSHSIQLKDSPLRPRFRNANSSRPFSDLVYVAATTPPSSFSCFNPRKVSVVSGAEEDEWREKQVWLATTTTTTSFPIRKLGSLCSSVGIKVTRCCWYQSYCYYILRFSSGPLTLSVTYSTVATTIYSSSHNRNLASFRKWRPGRKFLWQK